MSANPFKHRGSIANRRRGRKGWQSREHYKNELSLAATNFAALPAPSRSTTDWTITGESLDGAETVVWTFARFYAHMAEWTDAARVRRPSFTILPAFGFNEAIADILASGATVYTGKAKFQLIKGN